MSSAMKIRSMTAMGRHAVVCPDPYLDSRVGADPNASYEGGGRNAPAWRALLALGASLMFSALCVQAQSYPADDSSDVDPPARVGRIAYVSGPVSLVDTRSGDEDAAVLNWPVTTGHRISTGRFGRAEVSIGSFAIRLDDETTVDFSRVDDQWIQLVIEQGSAAVRVRSRDYLGQLDLLTPRERVTIDDVGRYRIDVDRVPGITAVTAQVGYARVASGGNTFAIQSGQRGEISSTPMTGFQLVGAAPDEFDDWVAARDQRGDALASRTYVSRETTGVEALDDYGAWRSVPDYGEVWYPNYVPAGWMPYRYGRWGHVAPWGWTWIDEQPWGFAPFHYGRWVQVGGMWAWSPGARSSRPVFAPALVAWYGTPGIGVSVGWFPLGWQEVYVPGYHCSRGYVNAVNVQHVTNITQITVISPPAHYVYQTPRTSTWVRGDVIARAEPIHRVIQAPPADVVRLPATTSAPVALNNLPRQRFGPPVSTDKHPDRLQVAPRAVAVTPGTVPSSADNFRRVPSLPPPKAPVAPGFTRGEPIAPRADNAPRALPSPNVNAPAVRRDEPPARLAPRARAVEGDGPRMPPAPAGATPPRIERAPESVHRMEAAPVPPTRAAPAPHERAPAEAAPPRARPHESEGDDARRGGKGAPRDK